MERLSRGVERLSRQMALVDENAVPTGTNELNAMAKECRVARDQLAELDRFAAVVKDQDELIRELRAAWSSWEGVLVVPDEPNAEHIARGRRLLDLVLAAPIMVKPIGEGDTREWRFAGLSRLDGVLRGHIIAGEGWSVEHRPTPADVEGILRDLLEAEGELPATPAPRGTTWSIRQRDTTPISGGSDADEGGQSMSSTSADPHPPRPRPLRAPRAGRCKSDTLVAMVPSGRPTARRRASC